jgi:uncharacterized protein (TIGR02678 family)
MSNLSNQLVIAEREQVARGIRQLLASPLISERTAPDLFDLVRRRREPIRQWFDYYCGWALVVEPRLGYARLVKVRSATDPSRPARRARSSRAPFDRRRYMLLCVIAAELLAVPVTTIGLLADRVSRATAADDIVATFDSASRAERMALVDVLRLMETYGVLEVVDGTTDSFVETAEAKVLYRVDSTLLLRLLAVPVGPSQLAVRPQEVAQRLDHVLDLVTCERRYGVAAGEQPGAVPVSEVQRNLRDLSDQQRSYLASPTGRQLLRRAADQGGFTLEERAEGVLLVDTDAIATDSRFPDDASTAKVAALLLLDKLAGGPATTAQLEILMTELLARFPRWAMSYRDADGPAKLRADALAVLAEFRLTEVSDGVVFPLPAAARYTVGMARASGGNQADHEEAPS